MGTSREGMDVLCRENFILYGTIARQMSPVLGEGLGMSQASHYLDALTQEIGPRPAGSDTERQAAEWLQDQFTELGLPAELHDFDAPRSPASARSLCYLLVPLAIFGIGVGFLEQMWVIHWACWLALVAVAVLSLLDFFGPKGPAGLVALLPKGPSQNVIAKSIPSSYAPGEMPKKVVFVAHYDTELTSPLMNEATAAFVRPLQVFANTIVVLMPLFALTLILNIRLLAGVQNWIFYILLVLCVPGLILLVNRFVASIMNRYSPGANNNASGVAAMMLAAHKLTESAAQGHSGHTTTAAAVKLAAVQKKAADKARQSSKMPGVDYTPPPTSDTKSSDTGVDIPSSIPVSVGPGTASFEAADVGIELDVVDVFDGDAPELDSVQVSSNYGALDDYDAQATFADEGPTVGSDVLDAGVIGIPAPAELGADEIATAPAPVRSERAGKKDRGSRSKKSADRPSKVERAARKEKSVKPKREKKGFFSFGKKHDSHADDPSNWLGLEDDFNARAHGKEIGSWDNFGEDAAMDEELAGLIDSLASAGESVQEKAPLETAMNMPTDAPVDMSGGDGVVDLTDSFAPMGGPRDDFGGDDNEDPFAWKGGFAGDDPIEDSSYASAEAARIRRKVLDSLDVELKEKEVWFVATGAHFAERGGAQAFMKDYSEQLRGALFVNIASVGSGDLYWSSKERFGKKQMSAARLTSMLRRLSRESDVRIKPWKKTLISDAGPILAVGRKAITITRLSSKGIPFALASSQDTAARLDSSKIDEVAVLASKIIREA